MKRVKLNALFIDSNLKNIAPLNDAICLIQFTIGRDLIVREESLELLGRPNNLNLMVGSKKCTELMLAILGKCRVWLKFRVAIVGFVVVRNGFATRAEADNAKESVADTGLLHVILSIGKRCIDDDVGAEGNRGDLDLFSFFRIRVLS